MENGGEFQIQIRDERNCKGAIPIQLLRIEKRSRYFYTRMGDCAGEAHGHGHGGGGDGDGGHHGHSHGADGSCMPEDPDGGSLLPFIDTEKVRCLNERVEGSGRLIFRPAVDKLADDKFVQSEEDDPELILHIPFTVAVKLKSLCLIGGVDGQAPSKLKLFTNREDVDFEMANELPPVQELELVEDFAGVVDYPVKAAKFNMISSLTIFIPENFGADSTKIHFLGLKGEGTTARRGVVETTYEARAQLKDHESTKTELESMPKSTLS